MNKKKLTISTSTSSSTNNSSSSQWDQQLEEEDKNDVYAPPSSPPPPHLILIPDYRNAGTTSWHQNENEPDKFPEKKKQIKLFTIVRRQSLLVAKRSIKVLLQNNNLLLIANIVNKLWRARASFIRPIKIITNQVILIVQNNTYQNMIDYIIQFIQYQFNKQQHNLMNTTNTVSHISHTTRRDPLTTAILLWATVRHLSAAAQKVVSKWSSNAIRNMGGLDSVILAFTAIAFAKSIQKSERIF